MNSYEIFGDWIKIIDVNMLTELFGKINRISKHTQVYPDAKNVFKAFQYCNYNDCKVIMISQDPYSDGRATGIAFANNNNIPDKDLSPSLKVIKNAVMNLQVPETFPIFDQTMERWEKQGILMLNSALTVEKGKPDSHIFLWRPFITSLLKRLNEINTGMIYVLFGNTAKTLKPLIERNNFIIEEKHPSWYARNNMNMPDKVFIEVNKRLKMLYSTKIEWLING